MKVIENGEMVAFDTDTIGPFGMCVDLSRSWVCGDKPNDWQRKLYQEAYNQLQRNIEIIKPGKSTIELGL